jgi:hypothetical protein
MYRAEYMTPMFRFRNIGFLRVPTTRLGVSAFELRILFIVLR